MMIIGEKINATRKSVRAIVEERQEDALAALAQDQAGAGTSYIDVNVGTGRGSAADEIDAMKWAVAVVCGAVDKPLCIDSADPPVLEAGLSALNGRPAMINSTKADDKSLGDILPLAAQYQVPVVALAMDDKGIPETAEGRLAACRTIADRAEADRIPLEHVYFDPLVLPISTDAHQGRVTLDTLAAIKENFPGARTTMGLSNISYGLPGRSVLNAAFLHMAAYAGLDAVIMDPLDEVMMDAVRSGEALMGKDRHFRKYTRAFRKKAR
jgi:5-methyltetrahydrofolate--homocysteine methyltransferase